MIRRYLILVLALVASAFIATAHPLSAHEVRPAHLIAEEGAGNKWAIIWKQPILEGKRIKIAPEFLSVKNGAQKDCGWRATSREILDATSVERGQVTCPVQIIRIAGLERTLTDAIVEVRPRGVPALTTILRPDARSLDLRQPVPHPASSYLALGIEHILLGWDHLLFVIGLVLIIGDWRRLIGVATAFTLAHSLSLGLAALGFVGIPSRPVEILIAASIVLLAIEILRKMNGQDSVVLRRPYLVAIVIGLVHGLGFAGALAEIGLPKNAELIALLWFNIGVELGQIIIIAVMLGLLLGFSRIKSVPIVQVQRFAAYGLGAIGMFWLIDRMAQYAA